MKHLIQEFQRDTVATSINRNLLLERLVAINIAYAAPVPVGELSEGDSYYSNIVIRKAMKVISEVNETIIINTDGALALTRKFWEMRYVVLNSPAAMTLLSDVYKEQQANAKFGGQFERWTVGFEKAVRKKWNELD